MSSPLRTLTFAVLLGAACSLLLTAAATGLKRPQLRNIAIDRQRNILLAVGLLAAQPHAAPAEVERRYSERIRSLWLDRSGQILPEARRGPHDLPLYLALEGEEILAYVVPIDTQGLWGRIRGYLAIERDGATVRGFTVYQHAETPGLGGEIERRWFQKNFEGKKIVNRGGKFISVSVAKGAVDQAIPEELRPHYVDGISGATLTGQYLSAGLREILAQYEVVAIRFRQDPASIAAGLR
jgi:Na+-transporting NADH:ubiquinone oxidoreductase subunit C